MVGATSRRTRRASILPAPTKPAPPKCNSTSFTRQTSFCFIDDDCPVTRIHSDISKDYHVLPSTLWKRSRMHQQHRLQMVRRQVDREERSEDWTTSNARFTCFPILVVLVLGPVWLFTKQVAYLVSGNGKLIGFLVFLYFYLLHS